MMKLIPLILLGMLVLIMPSIGAKEITGGTDVRVIGIGQDTSGGTPPIFDTSYRYPRGYIDPSKFRSPSTSKIPPFPPEPSNDTLLGSTEENVLTFQMVSSANGTGSYTGWKSVNNLAGLASKQTTSTMKGDAQLWSALVFVNSKQISSSSSDREAVLVSRDVVQFNGKRFLGSEKFFNDGDSVSNYFNTNRTLRESIFFGSIDFRSSENAEDITENESRVYNKTSQYNLGAGYNGAFRFKSLFNNETTGSMIEEDYTGNMALTMKLNNQVNINLTWQEGDWIPCCAAPYPSSRYKTFIQG